MNACSGYLKHPSQKEELISSEIPRIDPYSVVKRNYEVTECTTLFSVTERAKLRQESGVYNFIIAIPYKKHVI
jgi:hypothetical protein